MTFQQRGTLLVGELVREPERPGVLRGGLAVRAERLGTLGRGDRVPQCRLGFGGGFAVVYSVEGAGGYQLFGRSTLPVLDVTQRLKDFRDSIVFPKTGDMWIYRRIDREEFELLDAEVE